MASIIRIKRSEVSGNPSTLAAGELAYSSLADNGANGGDRLYIGMGSETGGNAANHVVIGGKYFTDMLNAATSEPSVGTLVKRDANGDIRVNNIIGTISGTAESADKWVTPRNLSLTGDATATLLNVDGTTNVSAALTLATVNSNVGTYGSSTSIPVITVNAKGLITGVTTATISTSLSVGADSGVTDTVDLGVDTLTIAGGTGLSSVVTNNTVTINLDSTGVTSGSYGSATAIPTFTVDNQGRLTAAGTVAISTALGIAGDTGSDTVALGTDTLNVLGGEAIDVAVTNNTITISAEDATSSNKGVASFSTSGFVVSSGDVTLKTNVVQGITTDTGTLTVTGNAISILGNGGIDVTHVGNVITVHGEDASTSNKGIASFDTNDFTVTAGAVSIKTAGVSNTQLENSTVTLGSTTVALGATSTSIAGLTQLDVDQIRIDGNEISATNANGGVSIKPNGTGHVSVNNARVENVADPVNPQDAATKNYVDTAVTGLKWKAAVHVLSKTNVALTGTGALSIDSHQLSNEYRILLIGQTTASENGIYSFSQPTPGGAYTLTRAIDADSDEEIIGLSVFVMEGTLYGTTAWIQSSHYVTAFAGQTWTQFGGNNTYVAGNALVLDGNVFNVNLATNGGLAISSDELQLASSVAGTGLVYASGVLSLAGSTAGSGLSHASGVLSVNTANGLEIVADNVQLASTVAGTGLVYTNGVLSLNSDLAGTGLAYSNGVLSINTQNGIEISGDTLQLASTVAGAGLTLTSGVLAVVGTSDRIAVSADHIDIASTYVGQTSITTLGTIATGTWNADTIAVTKGGTGLTSCTTGDLLVGSGANALSKLAVGTAGKILQSNGTTLVYADIDGGTY